MATKKVAAKKSVKKASKKVIKKATRKLTKDELDIVEIVKKALVAKKQVVLIGYSNGGDCEIHEDCQGEQWEGGTVVRNVDAMEALQISARLVKSALKD